MAVWIPLTPSDVPELERLLRSADPFVASTIDTDDPYRLDDFVQHSIYGGAGIAALLDRNLVSRAVDLARGQLVEHSRGGSNVDRVAAACMAFLITAQVLTEPSIALYELVESVADADGQADLDSFRIADHLHPQAYLEVALSRAPGIHPDLIDEARLLVDAQYAQDRTRKQADLQMPLRHWRRHRCALTQIALLERRSLTGAEKFRQLLEWSVEPGFFDGLAIALAARLFGRANLPGRLLKSAQSPEPEKCFAGVRNAAWDLTYVSYWSKRSVEDEGKRIWILCTYDKNLRDLARVAVGEETAVTEIFTQNWPPAAAGILHQHYLDARDRAQRSEDRLSCMPGRFARIDALRESIENEIEEVSVGSQGVEADVQ